MDPKQAIPKPPQPTLSDPVDPREAPACRRSLDDPAPRWGELVAGMLQGLYLVLLTLTLAPLGLLALRTARSVVRRDWPPFYGQLPELMANTALCGGVATLTGLILGGVGALLLVKTSIRSKGVWWVGLAILAAIPLYVTTTAWIDAFRLPTLSQSVGGEDTWPLVIAGAIMGWAYAPLAAFVIAYGLARVDADLEDAARLDGGGLAVLARISLPAASHAVLAAALLLLLLSTAEMTVTDALWAKTLVSQIFLAFQRDWSLGAAALAAAPQQACVLLLFGSLLLLTRRWFARPEQPAPGRPWARLGLPGQGVAALVLLAIVGGPLLAVLRLLVHGAWSGAGAGLMTTLRILWMSAPSIYLALGGAVLATLLSAPLAWWLGRPNRRGPWRWLVGALLLLLASTPAPLLGVVFAQFWNQHGLRGWMHDRFLSVMVLYAARTLPAATLILWAATLRLPRATWDLIRLDGVRLLPMARYVVLPFLVPAMGLSVLICYLIAFAEVGAVVILGPPGGQERLFAVFFATQIHFGTDDGQLARMSIVPVLGAGLPTLAALWLYRRRTPR